VGGVLVLDDALAAVGTVDGFALGPALDPFAGDDLDQARSEPFRRPTDLAGVALAYGTLIERELASGTLVRLLDAATAPVLIYSLACLEERAAVPKIAAFRTWIMAEVETASPPLPAARPAPLRVAARAG